MNSHVILATAETTLSHKANESMETTSLIRKNTVKLSDGTDVDQPNISAWSFRHTIREHAALKLCKMIGVTPIELPEKTHIVLFSGGGRLSSSETYIPLEYKRLIKKYIPMLDMLGTTTDFCMLEGNLKITYLGALLRSIASERYIEKNVVSKFGLNPEELPETVTEFQYNTKSDSRVKYDNPEKSKQDDIANIFDTQLIQKGTKLGSFCSYSSDMVGSCLASTIEYWEKMGGYIGGQSSQGNGIIACQFVPELPSPKKYEDYVEKNKGKIKDMLMEDSIWENRKKAMKALKSILD